MTTLPAREPETEPTQRTDRAGLVESRAATGATPAARVLALQRSAGNRAVTALLARDPMPNAPPAKTAPPAKVTQLVVPDIGAIPLLSYSFGRPSGGHVGSGGPAKVTTQEITVTTVEGPHSAALALAVATGKPLGNVALEVVKDGKLVMRLKLIDAMVTSYSLSGSGHGDEHPTESWTINAAKMEWESFETQKAAD